jgi:hypothetical protein
MRWSIIEGCIANKECGTFQPYLEQGKAVYAIECTEEMNWMKTILKRKRALLTACPLAVSQKTN